MPSRRSSQASSAKVDARDFDKNRQLLHHSDDSRPSTPEPLHSDNESLLGQVADGILQDDRRRMRAQVLRYLSYGSGLLSCLCAGGLSVFSLYGHLFQTHLQYNQYEVNAISIASGLALYLPVPIFGMIVDRFSSRPVSLFAGLLFAAGYTLAAYVYKSGPTADGGLPVPLMVFAFVCIGLGTCSMYLAATAACVKNLGRGKHKGLALALPIASFGLSGMWQSQIGSVYFHQEDPDGQRGDVDVFGFFIFLAALLLAVGVIGALLQRVVDEEALMDEAESEMERSGLLPIRSADSNTGTANGYGTVVSDLPDESALPEQRISQRSRSRRDSKASQRKAAILNSETRLFLSDPTMWLFALGFFFLSGSIETYINNLGTLLATLYPSSDIPDANKPAAHVSILAIASTVGRLGLGTLSDVVSPSSDDYPSSLSSMTDDPGRRRFSISRISLLVSTSAFQVIAFIILIAIPSPEPPPSGALSATALLGLANGGSFSLVPIVISTVWGVSNFATNWGIVATMPALGATVWSALYSFDYQLHAGVDGMCFGKQCWIGVVAAMAVSGAASAACWAWARWGKGGWVEKGIIV